LAQNCTARSDSNGQDSRLSTLPRLASRGRIRIDDEARADRVCELNVRAQVQSLCHSPIVRNAWERGQKLDVHGWIYRLSDGRLRDLKCAPCLT
jgi:carbonic anhydrase